MLKASTVILVILALVNIIWGIIYCTTGEIMSYHQDFIGKSHQEISTWDPQLAELTLIALRIIGVLSISTGILVIAVALKSLRKGERWAWWTLLIAYLVVLAPMVAITQPVGGIPWISSIVLLLLFLFAVGLAAKPIFSKRD